MAARRAQPHVTVTAPAPVVIDGRPVAPAYLAAHPNTSTARLGPRNIRALPQPDPSDDPNASDPTGRTGRGWTSRWSVRSLPDPAAHGGSYWLGAASAVDGTAGIQPGARQWAADNDSGPAWHSFFPYKPSVVSVSHYLEGGDVIAHPKGVNMNSHYIEHMWLDWGSAHRQPFTWLIAACATRFDPQEPRHFLLDSGKTPPALSTGQLWQPHPVAADPDGYRSLLALERNQVLMRTTGRTGIPAGAPRDLVRARTNPALHPRLYIGIFNGNDSRVGVYGPRAQRLHRGRVANSAAFAHRYYVLGRQNGTLDQRRAGSVLIFEIRYFNRALNSLELAEQYKQIAGTYHFHRYLGS